MNNGFVAVSPDCDLLEDTVKLVESFLSLPMGTSQLLSILMPLGAIPIQSRKVLPRKRSSC